MKRDANNHSRGSEMPMRYDVRNAIYDVRNANVDSNVNMIPAFGELLFLLYLPPLYPYFSTQRCPDLAPLQLASPRGLRATAACPDAIAFVRTNMSSWEIDRLGVVRYLIGI